MSIVIILPFPSLVTLSWVIFQKPNTGTQPPTRACVVASTVGTRNLANLYYEDMTATPVTSSTTTSTCTAIVNVDPAKPSPTIPAAYSGKSILLNDVATWTGVTADWSYRTVSMTANGITLTRPNYVNVVCIKVLYYSYSVCFCLFDVFVLALTF